MRFESVWAVYFSACGSTRRALRRMAEAAGEALALPVRELDYTLPPAREQNYAFGEGDLIFWGSRPTRGGCQCAAAFFAGTLYRRGRGGRGGGTVRQPRL